MGMRGWSGTGLTGLPEGLMLPQDLSLLVLSLGSCLFLQLEVVIPGDLQVGTQLAASRAQCLYLWVASVKGARILLWFLRAGIFFCNACEHSQDESTRTKGGA